MPSLRNAGQPAARRDPPAARYADLEAGSGAQMPLVQDAPIRAPVHMIRLTKERKIAPYAWVHPDDDR